MLTGIALAKSELPLEVIDTYGLSRRVCERGGEPEVQFLFEDKERVLPVWLDGRLRLLRWGTRRGESRCLPLTGWTRQATVEAGSWAGAESVVIPATLGLEQGVWYRIRQGVRGLVAADEAGQERVYVLCEPASHYYRVMTRSAWMPVLVGDEFI
jgi:hypothetical protein